MDYKQALLLNFVAAVTLLYSNNSDARSAQEDIASTSEEFLGPRALIPPNEGRAMLKKARSLKEPAWLYVETEPADAEIRVDGNLEGKGRAFVKSSSTSLRQITISAPGYETVDGFIELSEREVTKLRIPLKQSGGRLTVLTDPTGATVKVDGNVCGKTPITIKNLRVGPHQLALTSGSWSWTGTVNVSENEVKVISIQMGEAVAPPAPDAKPHCQNDSDCRSGQRCVSGECVAVQVVPPHSQPTPVPQASPTPTPKETPSTTPPVSETPTSGKPKCSMVCDRFIQAVAGSPSIREPIRNRCMERCEAGDMKFSVCAWKARTMEDVSRCSALPESK